MLLEKYKDELKTGTYLKIKEHIEDLESQLKSCSEAYANLKMEVDKVEGRLDKLEGELEQQTHNARYWRWISEQMTNGSFSERLKLLFNKSKEVNEIKVWRPVHEEMYAYLDFINVLLRQDFHIHQRMSIDIDIDKFNFKIGNVFKTIKEAEFCRDYFIKPAFEKYHKFGGK